MLKKSLDSMSYLALIRACWRLAEGDRMRMASIYVALFIAIGINLTQPMIWGRIVDVVADEAAHPSDHFLLHLSLWIGAMVLALMGFWLFHGPARIMERRFAFDLRSRLTQRLYGHVTDLPWDWHQTNHTGQTLNRLNYAVEAVYMFADEQFGYLDVFFSLIGSLAVLVWIAPPVGLMMCISIPVLLIGMALFDRRLSHHTERQNHAEHYLAAGLFDYLGNIATVLTLRLQSASRSEVDRRLHAISAPRDRTVVINEQKWFFIQMFLQVIMGMSLILYAVLQRHERGIIDVGTFVAVFRYLQQIATGVGGVGGRSQSLLKYRVNLEGLKEIEAAFNTHARPANDIFHRDWRRAAVRGINFTYSARIDGENRRASLQDVDMDLTRGRRIALVGPSGSGKSTLLRLLAGLHAPDSGTVSFDDDTASSLVALAGLSTLVPQDTEIFENTMRYNVTCGLADDGVLRTVMHMACLDTVLQRLAEGIDTVLTERGTNLSGGQKQRVALARGLFAARDSSLLLMDEPTSALDPGTEALVYDRIFQDRPDACIVSSIHRLHLLERFDHIYVMESGRVVEQGNFAELLEQNGLLAQMWAKQTNAAERSPVIARVVA